MREGSGLWRFWVKNGGAGGACGRGNSRAGTALEEQARCRELEGGGDERSGMKQRSQERPQAKGCQCIWELEKERKRVLPGASRRLDFRL